MSTLATAYPGTESFDPYTVQVLIGTDRLYFELAARRSSDSGLDLLYLDGHQASPSGAVIWGVDRQCGEDRFRDMLSAAEAELRDLGGRVMRVYVEDPVPEPIARALGKSLYASRTEVALLGRTSTIIGAVEEDLMYTLRLIDTDEQWEIKREVHSGERGQADGYHVSPANWVNLERKKSETGGMSCYLVLKAPKGEAVAAVSLIRDRGISRLKNLYVRSNCRKSGVGLSTVRLLAREASSLGYEKFGCFAVEGGNAIRVYQRAGLRIVGSVTEFSRELVAPKAA